jgi:hypothetical protein
VAGVTSAVHVQYVSDNGTTYQRRTLADLATALGLTTEAIGAHASLPHAIRPRYILGRDPDTGREHKLRGVAATHTGYTGGASTIDVPDPSNRSSTLTLNIAGRMGERRFAG